MEMNKTCRYPAERRGEDVIFVDNVAGINKLCAIYSENLKYSYEKFSFR
jgi:hypothetical protein